MENSLYAVWKSNTGTNKGGGAPWHRFGHLSQIRACSHSRTVSVTDCQIHLTGPVLICQSQDTCSSNCFWLPWWDALKCLLTGPEGSTRTRQLWKVFIGPAALDCHFSDCTCLFPWWFHLGRTRSTNARVLCASEIPDWGVGSVRGKSLVMVHRWQCHSMSMTVSAATPILSLPW